MRGLTQPLYSVQYKDSCLANPRWQLQEFHLNKDSAYERHDVLETRYPEYSWTVVELTTFID